MKWKWTCVHQKMPWEQTSREKIFGMYITNDQHLNLIECWQIKKRHICYLHSRKEDCWLGEAGWERLEFPKLNICEHKKRAPREHAAVWCQQQVWVGLWLHLGSAPLLCPRASRLQAPASNFVSFWVASRDFNLIWFSLATTPVK